VVDFAWPRNVTPEKGVTGPHYSVRWTGTIVVPPGGAKSIGIDADDGGRVSIDGRLFAETTVPGRHMSREPISEGPHTIQIEYWNRAAQGHVMLIWILSGRQVKVVPGDALFH